MMGQDVVNIVKWIGTALGIAGAIIVASNTMVSGYGYILFLFSSFAWIHAGVVTKDWPLLFLNLTFGIINVIGIFRWLI